MIKIFKFAFLLIFALGILTGCAKTPVKQNNFGDNNPNKSISATSYILYVGHGCPHCLNVEEYIIQSNLNEKIFINITEVFENKVGASDFMEKAKICGLDQKSLGVPVLYANGKCFSGDEPIINFLKENVK